jgi:hypothetical protein
MNTYTDRPILMHADKIVELLGRTVSPEGELKQAFEADEIVVTCWEPGCTMHRLPHWDEKEWVSCESKEKYHRYSHGICRWHLQKYEQEVDRFVAAEKKRMEVSSQLAVISGS